ncbi:FkbM family methyltransferase [Georgenia subflava]|uniref:FkbM family methyltransferase n=1 Tax=Georgenia subflava TaxID=1622177 RepID=UPI001D0206B8|nr:FkbM family methyltransferase [Georgenia subflava]
MTERRRTRAWAIVRLAGLARSTAESYATVWRRRPMVAFYRQFVDPGDLAFDVGSHAGNRVRVFRRIGAKVVAVEPQPELVTVLRWLYGRDRGVRIEACAVGAEAGRALLHVSSRHPTVSSLAPSWMREVAADRRFASTRWDAEVTVAVTTLDELIARHGEPRFCKIDVEGLELAVLTGLSRPLAALSFEYIPVVVERAVACVERLAELGDYRFRRSRLETLRWTTSGWLDTGEIVAALRSLPPGGRSGDIYAVRADRLVEVTGRRGG